MNVILFIILVVGVVFVWENWDKIIEFITSSSDDEFFGE